MKKKVLLSLIILGALALQACGASESSVATSVAATLQISQLETAAAGGGQADSGGGEGDSSGSDSGSDAGESGSGDPTTTPTPSLTPTPSTPMVSVSVDTNCRTGPRLDYDYVTTIEAGTMVEVLQTFPGANYVVVRNPNSGGDCWLWLQYADRTDFSDYGLAQATQPPTPTPTNTPTPTVVYDWSDTWTTYVSGGPYSMVVTQGGSSFSATIDAGGGETVTLTGSTSNGGREASGNWSSTVGTSGTFQFRMFNNLNQFQGNINGAGPWCGSRNGAGQPSTCQWP